MPLTDTAIRSAKPQDRAFKLFDGGGLYLEVNPAGGKWWRWKYRFGGKEKRLSLGIYPDVSRKAAREKRLPPGNSSRPVSTPGKLAKRQRSRRLALRASRPSRGSGTPTSRRAG